MLSDHPDLVAKLEAVGWKVTRIGPDPKVADMVGRTMGPWRPSTRPRSRGAIGYREKRQGMFTARVAPGARRPNYEPTGRRAQRHSNAREGGILVGRRIVPLEGTYAGGVTQRRPSPGQQVLDQRFEDDEPRVRELAFSEDLAILEEFGDLMLLEGVDPITGEELETEGRIRRTLRAARQRGEWWSELDLQAFAWDEMDLGSAHLLGRRPDRGDGTLRTNMAYRLDRRRTTRKWHEPAAIRRAEAAARQPARSYR
jgi:hypothetical protein